MYTKPIPVTNPPKWVPAVSSLEALYIGAHTATYAPPSGESDRDLYQIVSAAVIHHGNEGMDAIREFLRDPFWKLPLCWVGVTKRRRKRLVELAMRTAGELVDKGDSESAAVHYAIAARLDTENPAFREDELAPHIDGIIGALCERDYEKREEKLAIALGNFGFTMSGLYLGSRRVAAQALREGRLASVISSIIKLYADDISAARTQGELEVLIEQDRVYRKLLPSTDRIKGKRAVLSALKHSNLFVPIPEDLQRTFVTIQMHFPSDNPIVRDAMEKIGGEPYHHLLELITNRKIWG